MPICRGANGSSEIRNSDYYVSFWKLCSCRFGVSQIHGQSTPPFRKMQDGTHKSQQLHLKGVHIFSAPCQGVIFHYFPLSLCELHDYYPDKYSRVLGTKSWVTELSPYNLSALPGSPEEEYPRPALGRMEEEKVGGAAPSGVLIFPACGL